MPVYSNHQIPEMSAELLPRSPTSCTLSMPVEATRTHEDALVTRAKRVLDTQWTSVNSASPVYTFLGYLGGIAAIAHC